MPGLIQNSTLMVYQQQVNFYINLAVTLIAYEQAYDLD